MTKPLSIAPYDPSWPASYAAAREELSAALGLIATRIEHHGSTAVPSLAAKPIIDIQVSVRSLHPIAEYASELNRLGYVHLPSEDDFFCPFFHRPRDWPHTHHIHVVEAGGPEERRTLAFRDYLRTHPEVRREYEELKLHLSSQHSAETHATRQAYA
jgi:GrpB-like predicted nucleotidyltransferase (UPF0157 family)